MNEGFGKWGLRIGKISPTVPCSISTPLSITATLSQIRFTTSISCVINNMVMPSSSLIFLSKVKIDWWLQDQVQKSLHRTKEPLDQMPKLVQWQHAVFVRLTDWQGKHLLSLKPTSSSRSPTLLAITALGCLIIQAVGQCFQKSYESAKD